MSEPDISGRKKVKKNVISSWLSQLVFIVFGFVMPRMIDESLGQISLGIWDFAWTIVSYLTMAMVGIGSSVNRYVARYRASGEDLLLSSTMSSVVAIQAAIASGVLVIAVCIALLIPTLMEGDLAGQVEVAASIVLYLGAALSIQMLFDAFRGVLTGCHKWTIHNVLNAGGYAMSAIGMIAVLLNGGGLVGMAKVYLIVTVLTEMSRFAIARKVCPEIELRLTLVNRGDISKMVKFGVNTMMIFLPRAIIRQTVSLFVVANLGVSMLAVLARPLALTANINTMINKFAFVLTPTAGSLQGSGDEAELKEFALVAMRAGWIMTIFPISFMLVLGDRVVDLWMGPGYAHLEVIIILAAGSVLPMSQSVAIRLLVGMNEHGRISKYSLIVSLSLGALGLVLIPFFGWSLTSAAWLIAVPNSIGIGLVPLLVGCYVLNVSAGEYVARVLKDPALLLAGTLGGLLVVRTFGPQGTVDVLLVGMVVHILVGSILLRQDIKTVLGTHKS